MPLRIGRYDSRLMDVPYGEFSMELPWDLPPGLVPVPLRRAIDGQSPHLATEVALWRDRECLNVLFRGDDDEVIAGYFEHDAPLYQEDVVEIFAAPQDPTRYFEIEVNPLGTVFDALIHSPDGIRSTMNADLSWTCEGLFRAIRRTPHHFATIVRIPFAALGVHAPQSGDRWRGNLFRIDRHPTRGDEFSAWQPTMKTPADFHVAAAFGEWVFS
jgi:hypothetical protein